MANIKFAVGIQRLIPFLGYHHVLMMIITIAVTMTAVLLAGCTSGGAMSNVYILGLGYSEQDSTAAHLDVRVSYFGICGKSGAQVQWVCTGSGRSLESIFPGSDTDPANVINMASAFKSDVVFPGLLIGAIGCMTLAVFGLATFPGWHEEHDSRTGSDIDIKPFPSRPVSQAVAALLAMASLMLLTSGLWQHSAAAAVGTIISTAAQDKLVSHVGATAAALIWLSFALAVITFVGIFVMILSIHLLDRLTDD